MDSGPVASTYCLTTEFAFFIGPSPMSLARPDFFVSVSIQGWLDALLFTHWEFVPFIYNMANPTSHVLKWTMAIVIQMWGAAGN